MSRLVLKIQRGSQVIGRWSLGAEDLEITIEDSATGEILGSFIARGRPDGVDELPISKPGRQAGDDLTMPLPESTSSIELPMPEATSHSVSLPLDELAPEPNQTRTYIAEALRQRDDGLDLRFDSDTDSWAEQLQVAEDPRRLGAIKVEIPPAEVWLRKAREWHARGSLPAGSRLDAGGGWIGLDSQGRLVVCTGPRLTGTVTRLDGSSYELESGGESRLLSLGASVILRDGDQGVYVRSMLPDASRLDQPTEESTR